MAMWNEILELDREQKYSGQTEKDMERWGREKLRQFR